MPLSDCEGRIIGVLAGRPRDPAYVQACQNFFLRAQTARDLETFSDKETMHRRGAFPAIAFGISYGNGQTKPQRLSSGSHSTLIASLLQDRDLHRMASYADGAFQLWAPRLYLHYQQTLNSVENATGANRNFPGIAFACATLNLGPQVRTFKHRDSLNLPYGLCAIQSMGDFDPKLGGHLILWDLKLAIEFPPYSTILIPSACLTHSNTSVQEGECRLSFTQYSAGGLFRWVMNSCMTESELKIRHRQMYDSQMEQKSERWLESLKLYSTYEELTSCI
ncbi:hypothetical protein BJ165DRAFT_1345804 [Panaeolus papilionaceus]|nr:hypothetical protein BJ165DRAFT_1345804 [Panaeolus papilionaceus]